jgi:hypothetical protein
MRRALIVTVVLVAGCGPIAVNTPAVTPTPLPSATALAVPSPSSTPGHLSAVEAINAEADAYPGEYCGKYANTGTLATAPGGAIVSMWRANLDGHAAAIRAASDGTQPLAFVGCTYSHTELERAMGQLSGPDVRKWLATVPAAESGLAIDEINNQVEVDISSAVASAVERVTSHLYGSYRLGPDEFLVISDGNGAALRPWGTVRLTVLGPDRKPVHVPNDLSFDWSGELPNLECGGGDVGYGVRPDGLPTDLPCQAGTWRTWVDTGSDMPVLGSGTVTVSGGKTVELTIKVSAVPSPQP